MPLNLDLRIAKEITAFLKTRKVANPSSSADDRANWVNAVNKMSSDMMSWRFAKKKKDSDPEYWEHMGALALRYSDQPLRCSEFTAHTIYLLRMNKNFESNLRAVRTGSKFGENHYFILANSEPWPAYDPDPDSWGDGAFIIDAWKANQDQIPDAVIENCVNSDSVEMMNFMGIKPAMACQWDAR